MHAIRFLHIPKTAGTSLTECLRRIYKGPEFIFSGNPQSEIERYRDLDTSTRQRIAFVSGHAPRITGIDEIDKLPTITLLRNPVDRVKSFCQHVSEGKSPYLVERFPPKTFDLDDFLDSGNGELSNWQTKILLGKNSYNLPQHSQEELVTVAIDVLENDLAGFGAAEGFDKSLILLQHTFGWRKLPLYRKVNRSSKSKRLRFTNDQVAKICNLNDIDIPVYEKALDLFNRRVEKLADYLEQKLETFRRHQNIFSAYFKVYTYLNRLKSKVQSRCG